MGHIAVSSWLLFWRGNLVLIKESEHQSHLKDPRVGFFKHLFQHFVLLLHFCHFHSGENPSLCDHRKELWSNGGKGASARPGCFRCENASQVVILLFRVCVPYGSDPFPLQATGGSQVIENSPICALAEVLSLCRVSLPDKIITFIHGTLWAYVSLCKPFYSFCTFVLSLSIKIGLL